MAAQSGAHSKYVCACDAGLGELEIDGRGIFKGDCRFPARRLSNPGAPRARSLSASHARRVGKPGHIVSPLVIEIAIQEDGWKQAEFGWRNAHVLAIAEGRRKIAFELPTVVGLPDQIAERDTVAIQVLLDARGEDGAESGRTLLCEGPEQQAAANITGSVLNHWQVEALGLGPVMGDIV